MDTRDKDVPKLNTNKIKARLPTTSKTAGSSSHLVGRGINGFKIILGI